MTIFIQHANRGYVVFVVADAVCSRQRENYETALRRLGRAGIIICDAESVLFEWIRGADEQVSREVQSFDSEIADTSSRYMSRLIIFFKPPRGQHFADNERY